MKRLKQDNYPKTEMIDLTLSEEDSIPLSISEIDSMLENMDDEFINSFSDSSNEEPREKPARQSVRWQYTQQLPEDSTFELFKTSCHHLYQSSQVTYIIGALEHAPTTNKPHVQGYLELPTKHKKRLTTMKQMMKFVGLPETHLEIAIKSGEINRVYCLKLNTDNPNTKYFEFGEIRLQSGEKMKCDWEESLELAKKGLFDAINPSHQIQYFGNLQKIHFSTHRALKDETTFHNYWITGNPGVGKSRLARYITKGKPTYMKDAQNKWFDDYHHEPHIILDDLEKDAKHQGHLIKMIADRYPCRVEIKGASTLIRPEMIIVTSNYKISDIFEEEQLSLAIKRRFRTLIVEDYDAAALCYMDCKVGEELIIKEDTI